ncbi:MAG TPA: hypothetical protein VIG33_00660 [Pseudobdellovibrionaceae bacterium]
MHLILLLSSVFLSVKPALAAASGFTYTGKILDSNNAPVTATSVIFTVTVFDPAGKCWLYTEQRKLDLSQTAGTFSFEIGSSDTATLYGATPSFNNQSSGGPKDLADLFNNKKSYVGLGASNGCTGTYDPSTSSDPNEGRLLSVYFRVGSSGTDQAIPPLRITPVPIAMQSLAVNGYGTGELLRVDQATVASAGISNNALSVAQYTEFWDLMNKASISYLPVTGDVSLVGGNNKLTTFLGQALPSGPASNGQVLVSNGTAWVLQSMSGGSGTVTSVTGTAPVVVGGTASAPVVSLPVATTSASGYLTSTDWNTFNLKLSSSLASGKIFIGNASGLASEVSVSGDATLDNAGALTLKNTGTAGTYGSASLVPIVTTDAQGRVTSVTTAAPLDATKLPLAGGTMSGAINMGAQDITNSGNITMASSKTLGLSSNAADPGSPSAGQVWYNSSVNLIKFYDGSSVQSLGVAGAGITSLNGLTAGGQTFAIGTSGNSPAFSSATSTHTLNIPMASSASVTAGLISKAEYDAFTAKLGAVTNTATLAPTKIWIGDAGSKAQEFALSGDATMTSGGVVSVDKTQSAAASKILQLTASSVAVTKGTDIGGASTGKVSLRYPSTATDTTFTFPNSAGSANQFLQTDGSGSLSWGTPAATLPALASTQVWVGNASGAAAAVALSGDISSMDNAGVVTANKTTTAQASKLLSLDGSGVGAMMGNQLNGLTSGSLTLQPAAITTNYSLTFPAAQGAAGQTLSNNGSGVLSWASTLTNSLTSAKILVGNASGLATEVSVSGDATMDNAGVVTANKTTTAQANKLLSLDGSGVASSMGNQLNGSTSGSLTLQPAAITTNYSLTFPAAQGAAGQTLSNNGSGVLSWMTPLSSSTSFVNGGNTFAGNSSLGNNDNYNLDIKTNNLSRMTILNSGNIGIGTTSPATTLDINGSLKVGSDPICSADKAGAMHWTGSTFEGCNGTSWSAIGAMGTPAQNVVISFSGGNNQTVTLANNSPITNGDARAAWSVYTNLPNYLLGTLGTDKINGSNVTLNLSAATTCYLLHDPGWVAVDLTGWTLLESGMPYVSTSNNINVYSKNLGAGAYTFSVYSAIYSCVGTAYNWAMNGSSLYYSGGNVGIGTTTPTATLDVNGEVKFGNTSSICNASKEGQQRYNSISKIMEYCNGTAWSPFGFTTTTTVSCTVAVAGGWNGCTATCAAGYNRTGCSSSNDSAWSGYIDRGAVPSGSNACNCNYWINNGSTVSLECTAYCAK